MIIEFRDDGPYYRENSRRFLAPPNQEPLSAKQYWGVWLNYYWNENEPSLKLMEDWIKENCTGRWASRGNGGFTHAIIFEDQHDVEMFKEKWYVPDTTHIFLLPSEFEMKESSRFVLYWIKMKSIAYVYEGYFDTMEELKDYISKNESDIMDYEYFSQNSDGSFRKTTMVC